MPLIKGLDFPVRDALADLPTPSMAGVCQVCDPRGIVDAVSNKRYSYLLLPTSGTAFGLWRVDLESRAIAACAAPPAAAAGAYNTAIMAACFVPFGTINEVIPCVYVIVSLTAAPWNQLMEYNIRTNTWTVLTAVPGLGAAWATSIAICNTSGALGEFTALNANIRNRFLYISGDNGSIGGGASVSRIDQYNIVTDAHAILTGLGGVRGGAPAAGSKLNWLPVYPDRLYSHRGGGSTILDYYSFSTNAWTPNTPPQLVPCGAGTEVTTLYEAPGWLAVRPGTPGNEIFAIEGGGLNYQTICNISDSVLPAAHASNAMIAWWSAGQFYLGVIPYGTSTQKRIQIPMPL